MNKVLKTADIVFIIAKWIALLFITLSLLDFIFSFIFPQNSLATDNSYIEDLYSYSQNWIITDKQIENFPVVEYNRSFSVFILLLSVICLFFIKYFRAAIKSTLNGKLFSYENTQIFRKYIIVSIIFSVTSFIFDIYVNHLMLTNFNAHSNLVSTPFDWIDSLVGLFLTFVFYFLFKKGVSLKSENDLTI